MSKMNWIQVFSANLGKMMAIQENARKHVVKDRAWNVDFRKGIIAFGENVFPIQLIGTESNESNTWNWSWNNINNFPDSLIQLSNETLKKGETWKLEPLTVEQFEMDEVFNGHTLSIVACGINDEKCFYYRCPHSRGAVFVAVQNVPDEVFQPVLVSDFFQITLSCIFQQFPVDHKVFLENFLEWNQTPFNWNGDILTAHFEKDLWIKFKLEDNEYFISEMKME